MLLPSRRGPQGSADDECAICLSSMGADEERAGHSGVELISAVPIDVVLAEDAHLEQVLDQAEEKLCLNSKASAKSRSTPDTVTRRRVRQHPAVSHVAADACVRADPHALIAARLVLLDGDLPARSNK